MPLAGNLLLNLVHNALELKRYTSQKYIELTWLPSTVQFLFVQLELFPLNFKVCTRSRPMARHHSHDMLRLSDDDRLSNSAHFQASAATIKARYFGCACDRNINSCRAAGVFGVSLLSIIGFYLALPWDSDIHHITNCKNTACRLCHSLKHVHGAVKQHLERASIQIKSGGLGVTTNPASSK